MAAGGLRRARAVFTELSQGPSTYGFIHIDYILGNVQLARLDVSPTPREDAAWRMGLARTALRG